MITYEEEKEIRKDLKLGIPAPVIAARLKVSTDAIYKVRKMVEVVATITPEQRTEVQRCLEAGLPVGAIEQRTNVPRTSIQSLRRYFYLQPLRFGNSVLCPVCHAVRQSTGKFTEERLAAYIVERLTSCDDAVKMFEIIEDIAALGDSDLSINPLVHRLCLQAQAIVETMNGKAKAYIRPGSCDECHRFQVAKTLDGNPVFGGSELCQGCGHCSESESGHTDQAGG
jgi:hypothetical protein